MRQLLLYFVVEHHHTAKSFFEETICKLYLYHISAVYNIRCFGEIYQQYCCLENFWSFSFDDSTKNKSLWCWSISVETVQIFPKNFPNFRWDTTEKQEIVNLRTCNCNFFTSVVVIPSSPSLRKGGIQLFVRFPIVFFNRQMAKSKKIVAKFSCLYFRGYFIEACCFSSFNFFQYWAIVFLCTLT